MLNSLVAEIAGLYEYAKADPIIMGHFVVACALAIVAVVGILHLVFHELKKIWEEDKEFRVQMKKLRW